MCTIGLLAQNIPQARKAQTANIPHAQNKAKKDTVIEADTSKENQEPRYFYASVNTNVFVNTKGGPVNVFRPPENLGVLTEYSI